MRIARCLAALFVMFVCGVKAQTGGKLIFPEETDTLILQWADDTVAQYLALHNIPAGDSSILRSVARADLRDNLRSYAWVRMAALINDAPLGWDRLSMPEQHLLDKYRNFARVLRTDVFEKAVAEKNRFRNNKCKWQPDPELSKRFGYTYDGSYFCPTSAWTISTGQPPPAFPPKEYFIAYGQKTSWLDPLLGRQDGINSIPRISAGGALILGIGLPAAVGVGIAVALLITLTRLKDLIFPWMNSLGAASWVGAGITVALMLATVAVVIYLYTENERIMQEQDTLDTQLTYLKTLPAPDAKTLAAMLNDDQGRQLLYMTFVNMVLPVNHLFTPGPLPQPGSGDAKFLVQIPGQTSQTAADSITFPSWPNMKYRARIWGGWFLLDDLTAKSGTDPASINTRFRYYRDGVPYELDRMGRRFAIRKLNPASTDIDCPPDPTTGVSSAADFTSCKSYVSNTVEMDFDGVGRRIVSLSEKVVFTSPLTARVAWGTPWTIPIVTTATPFPAISVTTSLPPGFTFNPGLFGTGKANISWDGRTNSPALGFYDIGLLAQASDGGGTATLKVEVVQGIRFTLPTTNGTATYQYPAGQMVDLTVAATGTNPAPVPVLSSAVPSACGLSTTVVPGTSMLRLQGYILPPPTGDACTLTFVAGTTGNMDTMTLIFKVTEPPQPQLATRYFVARPNIPQTFEIITTGATGSISISLTRDINNQQLAPSYVSLLDRGNGTAQLTMVVPSGAPSRFLVPLWYRVTGTAGNKATSAVDGVVIEVSNLPVFNFFGQHTLVFVSGGLSWYAGTVQDATGGVTSSQPMPPGLTVGPADPGYFRVIGQPTGPCDTSLNIVASNAYGTSSIPIRIVCLQSGTITSADEVNFYLGRNNTFTVTGTGYPREPLPDLDQAYAMRFWVQNDPPGGILPGGLRFRTTDPVTGDPIYGRALITGTPAAAGQQDIYIFQEAGARQTYQRFRMKFVPDGDVNGDWQVDCSDISFITSRYGTRTGWPNYTYNADYNQDGVVDVQDTRLVSAKLPRGMHCSSK